MHGVWAISGANGRVYATTVHDLRPLRLRRKRLRATFAFEADGAIYQMARGPTGALVNVGLGKLKSAGLIKHRKRRPDAVSAPRQRLFWVRVVY